MCKQKRQMDGIILLSTIAIFCMMKHDFHFIKKLLCIFVRYSLFCALLYNAVLPLVLENKVAIMICLFAKISFATGDKAMGKAQRYTMEQIQAAQKSLRGLAVKNAGKTRAETVEFLAADIRKAVEQGYSLNESGTLSPKRAYRLRSRA